MRTNPDSERESAAYVTSQAINCIRLLTEKLGEGLPLAEAHEQTSRELGLEPGMTFTYLDHLSDIKRPNTEEPLIAYVNAVKAASIAPDNTIDDAAETVHASVMAIMQPVLTTRQEYARLNIIEQGKLIRAIVERYKGYMQWLQIVEMITDKLNISDTTMKTRMILVDLPEDMQKLLIERRITQKKAKAWLKDHRTEITPKPKSEDQPDEKPKDDEPEPHEFTPGTTCRITAEGEKNCEALVGKILTVIDHTEDIRLKQIVTKGQKKHKPIVIVKAPGEGPRPDQIYSVAIMHLEKTEA